MKSETALIAAALIALAGYAAAPAPAQSDEPAAGVERPQRSRADRSEQPAHAEHRRGARLGRLPGAHLFRPLPSDQGPLTDEEQQELIDFVRRHAPQMHSSLNRLSNNDPDNFRRYLQKAAPSLRRLRRVFERDPQLGRSIIRHSGNLQRLRRARRAWLESKRDRRTRRDIEDVMRRTLAENVEIEAAVLDDQLRELDWQRAARIEAEFERLASAEADLSGESPALRELIGQLHGAQAKDELEWVEDELWLRCAERMDREVRALQERLARMRADTAQEVDRRMKRLTSPGEPSGHRHGDHKRKRRD